MQRLGDALEFLEHQEPAAVVVDLGGVGGGRDWPDLLRQLGGATSAPLVVHTGDQSAVELPWRSVLIRGGAAAVQLKSSGREGSVELSQTIRDSIDRADRDRKGVPRKLDRIEDLIEGVIATQAKTATHQAQTAAHMDTMVEQMSALIDVTEQQDRRLAGLEDLVTPEPCPDPEPEPTPSPRWTWPPTRQQIAGVLGGASVLGAIAHEIWIALYGPAPDELPTPPPTEIVEQAPEE
ncbi:MAG: hypothetical protein AAFV53_38860 [Myxococcota bacterium]